MRLRREALGISQGRLGRAIGLTFSQVQKYEKGTNRIGAGRLYQIATILGVPLDFFFDGLAGLPAATPLGGNDEQTLVEAFRGIAEAQTRASVVALVCSLSTRRKDGESGR